MDTDDFVAFVKAKAGENFRKYGYLTPVILAPKDEGLVIVPLSRLGDKDEVARLIHRLRTAGPLLAVVTEAWIVELGRNPTPEQQESAKAVPPSQHPERKEAAMLTVYEGMKMTVHIADIIRAGKKARLGPWRTMDMTSAEGRLADPPPDWN